MQFISIGPRCNVKHQMEKHIGGTMSLFFDWFATDMDTVIKVFECKNVNDILTYDNIVTDPNNRFTKSGSRILIKSLPYCVSIHDFKINFDDNDIKEFLVKYKRRFNRMIEIIKSNKKICFIRYEKVEDNHRETFIQAILNINPTCDFTLVSINVKQDNHNINKSNHFLEINLTYNPTDNDIKTDWTTSYLNWKHIFKTITRNVS